MFKRKLLFILLPILVTSAFVGAGFSAWYFDSSYIHFEKSLGIKIEGKVETFGYIETSLPDNTVLKIDQGGFTNKADITKKICLYSPSKSENNGIINSFDVNYFIRQEDADALATDNTVASLTSIPTLDKKVAQYISIINGAMTINEGGCIFDFAHPTSTEIIGETNYYKFTYQMKVPSSDEEVKPAFVYKEGKKPLTKAAHDAMVSDLSDVTNALKINFSLTYKKGS